jgi:hypothetical protein
MGFFFVIVTKVMEGLLAFLLLLAFVVHCMQTYRFLKLRSYYTTAVRALEKNSLLLDMRRQVSRDIMKNVVFALFFLAIDVFTFLWLFKV